MRGGIARGWWGGRAPDQRRYRPARLGRQGARPMWAGI